MGIRFYCPNGHKLNVKSFQAGKRGICPRCGAKVQIPTESIRPSSKEAQKPAAETPGDKPAAETPVDKAAAETPASAGARPGAAEAVQPAPAASENDAVAVAPVVEPGVPAAEIPLAAASYPLAESAAEPETTDPLAEAPNVVWYVRPPSGGQFGPATSDVMRTWLDEGRVGGTSLVWREGWRDWQKASAVFGELAASGALAELAEFATTATVSPRAGGTRLGHARRRLNPLVAVVITVLVLIVVILLFAFIWILNQEPGKPGGEPASARKSEAPVIQGVLTGAADLPALRIHDGSQSVNEKHVLQTQSRYCSLGYVRLSAVRYQPSAESLSNPLSLG